MGYSGTFGVNHLVIPPPMGGGTGSRRHPLPISQPPFPRGHFYCGPEGDISKEG